MERDGGGRSGDFERDHCVHLIGLDIQDRRGDAIEEQPGIIVETGAEDRDDFAGSHLKNGIVLWGPGAKSGGIDDV